MREDFIKHKHDFTKLSNLLYSEFDFNGYSIKVLGINYMDNITNWSVKTHKHTFFEFHYILDGSVLTSINGIEKRLNSGEFYLMPPNTFHSHRQVAEETHLGLAIRWELLNLNKGSHGKNTSDMNLIFKVLSKFQWDKKIDNGDIYNIFTEIVKGSHNCTLLKLQLLFLEFLECLRQFYLNDEVDLITNKEEGKSQGNVIASSAIRFIDENYMMDIDMKDIANHIHISYSQLSRIFKKQYEITINNYLNKVRLSEAQKLLKCTNESINFITQKIGFNSGYYFSNAFKKVVGISPREYRKKYMYLDE